MLAYYFDVDSINFKADIDNIDMMKLRGYEPHNFNGTLYLREAHQGDYCTILCSSSRVRETGSIESQTEIGNQLLKLQQLKCYGHNNLRLW